MYYTISNNYYAIQAGITSFKATVGSLKFQVNKKVSQDLTKFGNSNEINQIVSDTMKTLTYWKKKLESLTDSTKPENLALISAMNFRKINQNEYKLYFLNDKRVIQSLSYLGTLLDRFSESISKLESFLKDCQQYYFKVKANEYKNKEKEFIEDSKSKLVESELSDYEVEANKLLKEERKKQNAKAHYYKVLLQNARPFSSDRNQLIELTSWPLNAEVEYIKKSQQIAELSDIDDDVKDKMMDTLNAEISNAIDEFQAHYYRNLKKVKDLDLDLEEYDPFDRDYKKITGRYKSRRAAKHIVQHRAQMMKAHQKMLQTYLLKNDLIDED
jgi:endogenous inhibitor of DNA gyrase (YacG/DUF329 family)